MWKLEKLVQHERLNSLDEEFLILVYKDIDGFLNEKSDRCVLIFPPLNNRRRYFIHKVGELFNVYTFSVGEGIRRLTVVCASDKIEKQVDEEKKVMDTIECKKGAISKSKRAPRPDAPIYIPPAIRRVQKTQLPDKNDKTNQSTKQSNRQKDNKKQIINNVTVTEMCNITETPQKSIDVNMKPDSSDLCTSQLVNDKAIKFESIAPVIPNVNKSKSESNVPDTNVINLTFENETSTIINNLETKFDESGHIVPCDGQYTTKSQESHREIIIKSKEKENITNDDQKVVELNIESKLTNSEEIHTPIDDNKAVNNDNVINKKKLWENKNNSNKENDQRKNNNSNKDNDQEQEELLRASEEINRRNKRIIKQSYNNSDILIISNESKSDKSKSNNENVNISQSNENEAPVDCWEDLLDDGGKLDSDLMLEIIDQVGNVHINKAKEDYSDFKQKTSLEGDYAHVLEIYDFPKEFTTRDLVTIIDSHKTGTYHIKWVDDNHALGVFSSGFVATEMLKISHPLIKIRPMSEASKQSISKAIRYPNAMMPSAVRPQTCAQTARRMVTGALGLKLINAKEERAKEIKILKEAREKKRLSARQQDDAWEGKPSSN